MEDLEIFEKVKKIILDEINCDKEKVTLEARLKEDLGADSIDAVQVIMDLEDTFEITIDEDEAQAIKTVSDIVNYVKKLLEK